MAWLAVLPITVLAASAIAPNVSFRISFSPPERDWETLFPSFRFEAISVPILSNMLNIKGNIFV